MVTLYVAGQKVGTLADAEKLIPEFIARNIPIELRGDGGELLGKLTPVPPPPRPSRSSRGTRRLPGRTLTGSRPSRG